MNLQTSRHTRRPLWFSASSRCGTSAFLPGTSICAGSCDESWKEAVDGMNVYWQRGQCTSKAGSTSFIQSCISAPWRPGRSHAGEALLQPRHSAPRDTSPDIAEESRSSKARCICNWRTCSQRARQIQRRSRKDRKAAVHAWPKESCRHSMI